MNSLKLTSVNHSHRKGSHIVFILWMLWLWIILWLWINALRKSIENKKWKQSFSAHLITEAYSELSQLSKVELLTKKIHEYRLHLRCLTRFWIRLRNTVSPECMIPEQPFEKVFLQKTLFNLKLKVKVLKEGKYEKRQEVFPVC